ncbi:hypothetical protein [Bacillus infantis]|uniref:Uncharacterized protein n=1 Tax=Bacillus infantis TaxID=324767 RepID=A0A5D4RRD1_9BACI|nr:hypothetical protein [Bacillus infantis]TYS52082.1 hypothetical protein FZD51_01145 [Bacillus infantis]
MAGLIISIIIFNIAAVKFGKTLTGNQKLHIWTFTIAFQQTFDVIIEFKLHGYWYFSLDPDFGGLLAHTVLLPPVNILFLSRYPFSSDRLTRIFYVFFWVIAILLYEYFTLLPEPWGYFHYGWWKLWHAAIADPILFLLLIQYYKWIRKLEGAS